MGDDRVSDVRLSILKDISAIQPQGETALFKTMADGLRYLQQQLLADTNATSAGNLYNYAVVVSIFSHTALVVVNVTCW